MESCYSVAGDHNYVLKVRVASPAALEQLLAELRASAHVTTRTTVVLSIPYENRPPDLGEGLPGYTLAAHFVRYVRDLQTRRGSRG